MDIRRCVRTVGTAGLVLAAAAACAGSGTEQSGQQAQKMSDPVVKRLHKALLEPQDLPRYRRQGTDGGTLQQLGYQSVAEKLQDLKVDKPRCMTAYMGGLSGPKFEDLADARAAMAVFKGKNHSFGQILVSVPAKQAKAIIKQRFPQRCTRIGATLPNGGKLIMTIREIDMPRFGDQERAFRGQVTVNGKTTIVWSETIRTGDIVHNLQVQGGNRAMFVNLVRKAHREAQRDLL